MKVLYRQAAKDDVVRQLRYYLVDQNLPEVAVRFRDAIRHTIESLRRILLSERAIIQASHSFVTYAHGRSLDLKPFEFTTFWIAKPST